MRFLYNDKIILRIKLIAHKLFYMVSHAPGIIIETVSYFLGLMIFYLPFDVCVCKIVNV